VQNFKNSGNQNNEIRMVKSKIFVKFALFFVTQFFVLTIILQAQLCNGNFGDPIINVTFGTGGSKLPASVTSFEYSGGCPPKGKYTVDNFLLGCGDRTWFLLAGDHTHDVGGSYMAVNAESTPGSVYIDTAYGLCGNTTYQFSAWIMNVMQKITCGGTAVLPNITFTVETISGMSLATFNTGDIPITEDKIWKQYGLSFKTGPDISEVVLTIKTTPVYGCGSSFAIDDIIFGMCGPLVTTTLDGNTGDVDVCAGYTNSFILNTSYGPGFTNPAVQWQNSIDSGKTWQNIAGAITTVYAIPQRDSGIVSYRSLLAERPNINSAKCRITSNVISTNVHAKPIHQLPKNISGCIGRTLILPYPSDISISILWNGPNGYISDKSLSIVTNVQYADTGLYKLKQLYNSGCTTLDSFYLGVFPGVTVFVNNPVQSICQGRTAVLSASGGQHYQWTPSDGLSSDTIANPIAQPLVSTLYNITISNDFGCRDSALVNINVFENVSINAGADQTINAGDSVILNATVKGTSVNFYWSPATFISDIHSVTPIVYPINNTVYTLTANSMVGCGSATSSVKIKVYKNVFIPNAFTPNDDGKNDKFRIIAADNYKQFKLLIFNKGGRIIYSTTNIMDGWDGRFKNELQPTGSYVYYIEMRTASNKNISKKGTIMLLR
jgi:gliding motility-associated-like protein